MNNIIIQNPFIPTIQEPLTLFGDDSAEEE